MTLKHKTHMMIFCCIFQPDLNFPDIPKALAWSGSDSLCVGFKKDYYLMQVGIISYVL